MSDRPVLLHTCCAPCLSGARVGLEDEGIPFTAYWFNPNIQPISERERRLTTFIDYRRKDPFSTLRIDLDGHTEYIDLIKVYLTEGSGALLGSFDVRSRCDLCYFMRLSRTATEAKNAGLSGFSTTLLLSKYQKHDRIKTIGQFISSELDIEFLYIDLRRYWGRSLDASRRYGLYRQRYCGCELSAAEGRKVNEALEPVQEQSEIRIEPCDQYKPEDSD